MASLDTGIHSFTHLTRTTLIERGGERADSISEDRIGFDVGHNSFHGLFTALNSLAGAALMGLRCNSEKDPGDSRSTNILFLIVPAHRALCFTERRPAQDTE